MTKIIITALLFFSLQPPLVAADKSISNDQINYAVSYLEDESAQWSINDILKAETLAKFKQTEKMPSFGYTTSAIWVAIEIKNPKGSLLGLKIKRSNLSSVRLFEADLGRYQLTQDVGRISRNSRGYNYFYFPLSSTAQEIKIYLRVASISTVSIPLTVMTQYAAVEDAFRESAYIFLYYGIIASLFLYNLLLYIFVKQKIYAFHLGFLTVFSLLQLSLDGLLIRFLGSNIVGIDNYANSLLGSLSCLALLLYSRRFLELRANSEILNKISAFFCGVFIIGIGITPFLTFSKGIAITFCFGLITVLFVSISSIASIRKGFMAARFFLAGNAVLLIATVVATFGYLGFTPADWSVNNALKIGSAIEVIFFSFALADRINLMTQEKISMQQSLLHEESLRRRTERLAAEESAKSSQHRAIASLTQMLAHDVRKPFSMLKIGIDQMITIGDDPRLARAWAIKIKEHVGRALEQVNGMLRDIMEVSSGSTSLYWREHSLKELIASMMSQVFRYDASCHVTFEYHLTHVSKVNIDNFKVQRVFANILDNARQAIKGQGRIWIHSKELSDRDLIEVTIGNSDSLIPEHDIAELFEAFFTKGKQGGTGLGLAIAKKIVTELGGSISCRSSMERGTEFVFTLPAAASSADDREVALPLSSDAVRADFMESITLDLDHLKDRKMINDRCQLIAAHTQRLGRPLEVLVIEDEALYSESINSLLEGELGACVNLTIVEMPDAALAACADRHFDLIITDVDFGKDKVSGFELVRTLRELRPEVKICIHSNRNFLEDFRRAIEAGADVFLPKPMSKAHALGLLVNDDYADGLDLVAP